MKLINIDFFYGCCGTSLKFSCLVLGIVFAGAASFVVYQTMTHGSASQSDTRSVTPIKRTLFSLHVHTLIRRSYLALLPPTTLPLFFLHNHPMHHLSIPTLVLLIWKSSRILLAFKNIRKLSLYLTQLDYKNILTLDQCYHTSYFNLFWDEHDQPPNSVYRSISSKHIYANGD